MKCHSKDCELFFHSVVSCFMLHQVCGVEQPLSRIHCYGSCFVDILDLDPVLSCPGHCC
uniref:Uncharacterized protein n=1 Tax=Arundo donax TaxID=35708 RepID=A0A0A9G949_ARUDO